MQGDRLASLIDKVLDMFPPLLHSFFLSSFAEPASWHNARIAFTRTTAVWSMVGHMLGLGDRHGENILMDTVTGDCIHIDFACLFDKVGGASDSINPTWARLVFQTPHFLDPAETRGAFVSVASMGGGLVWV